MKKFEFEKSGTKFFFRNPELNQYGNLVMEYKIQGVKENKTNDGYFYSSEFSPDKKAMRFSEVKINGQRVGGVGLPANVFAEVEAIYAELMENRKRNIVNAVNAVVSGECKIHFGIVGCDYPHYQPWIENLPDDLRGLEQHIMEKAIKKIMGDAFVVNPCQYIEKKAKKEIGPLEKLGAVLNPEYDPAAGFRENIVTGFEMALIDILQPTIDKKAEAEKTRQAKFDEARETGKPVLLRQWSEECCDPDEECSLDSHYEYAMPDGSTKHDWHHTW